MFFGEKPDLFNLKVFGCTAFKHIETHQHKLCNKAHKNFLLEFLRIQKHTCCTILTLKRLRFPLMRLLLIFFDFFAAYPSQNIRAFVNEKTAPKQVLPETDLFLRKVFSSCYTD